MDEYHVGGKHYNNKMNQSRITNLLGKQLLLARRLCEAGCGFVTVVDAGGICTAIRTIPTRRREWPFSARNWITPSRRSSMT